MRLFLGIILGCALTIGGAYVADMTAGAQSLVNWDVVGKHVRDGWKKNALSAFVSRSELVRSWRPHSVQ